MLRYIIRRIMYLIPLFLGVLIIVFVASRLAGDPVRLMTVQNPRITAEARDNLTAYYGLDQPLYVQFFLFLSQLFQGNLGNAYAIRGGTAVTTLIGDYAWLTFELQLAALFLSLLIAIPIGIISAKKQYSKLDVTVTTTSLVGTCIPIFYMGIIAIIIFSYILGWFPYGGAHSILPERYPFGSYVLDELWHMALPTAVLSERSVIYKHALRNTLIPIVTYVGLYFGAMLAGAPVTETVFNWPGVGRLFVEATTKLDFPVIMGITVFITIMTLIANLVTDITYGYIDPRIRVE
jgi:peptide/nickel transport system permease protein